jgi:hypothetical protein
MDNQLQFIRNAFNLNLEITNKNQGNGLNIGHDLYTRLNKILGNTLGKSVYKCDISPENLMAYKNGKVSSMLKNGSEISGHYGFDVVSVTNITDILINEINASLLNEVINNFNTTAFKIINSIKNMEYHISDKIIKIKENEYSDEIASYKSLLEEIASEIGLIANNPDRKIPYITNIIDMKRNIYKIYEYYLRKLNDWINAIGTRGYDNFMAYTYIIPINFDELNSDICFTRQIISSYMVAVIYEYLLGGNIDLKSEENITNKINNFINRYNSVYGEIKQKLVERDEDNKLFNWNWRGDKRYDSSNINWLLNNINEDHNFELKITGEVFRQIKDFLHKMILIE